MSLAAKVFIAVATAYIAFALIVTLAQGKLIYPAPSGPGVDVPGFERITHTTEDGLDISAGYGAADPGKPTIVYFHGNAADWQSSVVATDRLVPLGYVSSCLPFFDEVWDVRELLLRGTHHGGVRGQERSGTPFPSLFGIGM